LEAAIALGPASFGDLGRLSPDEAEAIRHTTYELLGRLIDALPAVLRHQARETVEFMLSNTAEGGVQQHLTIGFCALVDSPPITRAHPEATAKAISDFEIFAADMIGRRRGRLVKFVGDEVMFATSSVDDARDIAFEIMGWVSHHDHLSL